MHVSNNTVPPHSNLQARAHLNAIFLDSWIKQYGPLKFSLDPLIYNRLTFPVRLRESQDVSNSRSEFGRAVKKND